MVESLDLKQLAQELKTLGSPWEMDEGTDLALMTESERRLRLGFTPPPGELQLDEAVALAEQSRGFAAEELAAEEITAPAGYDLRNVNGKNFTTSVKNQGGCGSCVAFGTVAVMETTYKRRNNNPNFPIDLSEAQMFYCHAAAEGRNCGNGWWPDKALEKGKTKGVTFENFFPYSAGNQPCKLRGGWHDNLAKVTGYTKLSSRTEMKEWISTRGSITGCFVVYQDFFSYRSGVYRHVSGQAAGGHCVEIVGYNDAQGCWVCKNSWGTNWGEGGFFRIAYGQANIETWSGPYGANNVTLRSWVRNTKVNGLYTNRTAHNAHVHLAGSGWRKVTDANATVHHAMLSELIAAKAAARRVDALVENNRIQRIYVI